MTTNLARLSLLFTLLTATLPAHPLPQIPPSERILTLEEVRNYWINTLSKERLPKKPTGLHPEKQRAWARMVQNRKDFLNTLRQGGRDTQAYRTMLVHNEAAYLALSKADEAAHTKTQLLAFDLHQEKVKTLKLQQEAARKQMATAKEVEALRAQVAQLQSDISQLESQSFQQQSCPND